MAVQTQLTHDQHIVPQWHLKRFTDSTGILWRYMRGRPIKGSRPKGECWERDFYEYDVNGRKTENHYELWLSGIENHAAPIVDLLLNRQQLDSKQIRDWAIYVAALFKRTRKVRAQMSAAMVQKFRQQTESPEYIRDLQYELFKEGRLVSAEDLKKHTEQLRANMEGSTSFYHLSGLERHTASVAAALTQKIWHMSEAPIGKFFLLSDCPVMTVEILNGRIAPGTGFGKENTTVILPITPQQVFVAAPRGIGWKPVATDIAMEATNRLTIQFAHERVFAHVSSPEIKALVDAEINKIVFGQNAFVPSAQN